MANTQKTAIVAGASQGIGAAVVRVFLERGYNVVGTSRNATKSAELKTSEKLVLVDGREILIGCATTMAVAGFPLPAAAGQPKPASALAPQKQV